MALRRLLLRRSWIAGLLLAASLAGAVVTPGVVHVHTGGESPHTHDGNHTHHGSHAHSHGRGHSHRHSHRHSHGHDSRAKRDARSDQPHVHVTLLGWEFTLTLPGEVSSRSKPGYVRRTQPPLPKSVLPSDDQYLDASTTADRPLTPLGLAFFAADESAGGSYWSAFLDCWKPAPIPGRVDLSAMDECGGRIAIHNEAATARSDEPAVPPPRV